MSFLDLYSRAEPRTEADLKELFPPRSEVLTQISSRRYSDIVVVGGGIHGAMFARLAALHGLRTVLLERYDYAWATSSRTSKMAHGGLRYLELLDFKQVLEGIKAREDLLKTAPHLVHAHPFLLPLLKDQRWLRFKAGLGLKLYDLFLRNTDRCHRWIDAGALDPKFKSIAGQNVAGAYQFSDALMDDARLVVENIIAARQEGALCLNYARVLALKQLDDGSTKVGWRDELAGKSYEVHTGTVVNCAGPWAPSVGRLAVNATNTELRYSRGIHLLFNQAWNHPALLRYAAKRGQHYFIWPHPAGTLVGPTDSEVSDFEEDPVPQRQEVDALLQRVEHDFPDLNLNRSTLHFAYAGIRSLPIRNSKLSSADSSRRHRWIYTRGMLSLLGGKFTTAAWSVQEGFTLLCKMAGLKLRTTNLKSRRLPGASLGEDQAQFLERCNEHKIPEPIARATILRFGSRVRFFSDARDFSVVADCVLSGEIRLACVVEQVESLEDLVRRRLGIEYQPDQGFVHWGALCEELRRYHSDPDLNPKPSEYLSKINRIREEIGLAKLP